MKKIILASFVGAIVMFIWSFLAWAVLPMNSSTFHSIPNEDAVRAYLKTQLPSDGRLVYAFPGMPARGDQASMEAHMEKYRQGPNGLIFYDPQGSDPMMASQMVVGFILDVISCFLAAWFLTRSTAMTGSYMNRVAFLGMLGIFVGVFSHLVAWNWMGFPGDFTRALVLDSIITWVLVGLAMAAILKTPKDITATAPARKMEMA